MNVSVNFPEDSRLGKDQSYPYQWAPITGPTKWQKSKKGKFVLSVLRLTSIFLVLAYQRTQSSGFKF